MTDADDDARLSALLDGEMTPEAAGLDPDDPRLARLRSADQAAALVFERALAEGPGGHAVMIREAFAARRNAAARPTGWRSWVFPAAAAAAVLIVALVGFDREMDRRVERAVAEIRSERNADIAMLAAAVQDVLETRESGTPVRYANDATGTAVTLLPRRTWQSETGHWCREFAEIPEGADPEVAPLTTACRDADGTWRRVTTAFRAPLTPIWQGGNSPVTKL